MTAGVDRWIRWTTIASVGLLALIAGTVSYLHMHALVARHGQPGWVAALTPFSESEAFRVAALRAVPGEPPPKVCGWAPGHPTATAAQAGVSARLGISS